MIDASQSATYEYAVKFYELLVSQAKLEPLPDVSYTSDSPRSSSDVLVWRGKLQDAFKAVGASNVYYTRIRRIFLKYDCVTYLQRGTKSYDSVLVLNRPPPIEEISLEDLTAKPGDATLQALAERLGEAEHQLAILIAWRESLGGLDILQLASNVEGRISALERGRVKNGKTAKQD